MDRNKARLLEELEEVQRKARRREILERLNFFDGGAGDGDCKREERLRLEGRRREDHGRTGSRLVSFALRGTLPLLRRAWG